MMNTDTRIVEINGIKVEFDLRTAKRVDSFKVGDAVKILIKSYGDSYESHYGMIVGFDEFKELPTIIVAYLKPSSWESPLNFAYINSKSQNVEICPHDANDIGVAKSDLLAAFDREATKKEQELHEIKRKRAYFERMFGQYFPNTN
jgi:hypothetical protein